MVKKATEPVDKGECFVITRLGSEDSPERAHFHKVWRHLIEPVCQAMHYVPTSALHLLRPAGMIGTEIIQRLYEAPLVIADLSGRNPNVYYELAVRHGYKKAIVQIVQKADTPLPFDINQSRTVVYNPDDWDSVNKAQDEMLRQIAAVEADPTAVDNPIAQAFALMAMKESGDPTQAILGTLVESMQVLQGQVNRLYRQIGEFSGPGILRLEPTSRDRTLTTNRIKRSLAALGELNDSGQDFEKATLEAHLSRLLEDKKDNEGA